MTVGIIFEWDPAKAAANLLKHGVSFEDASTVFADNLSLTIPDPAHSGPDDERFITIGWARSAKTLVVVHTDHDETIRIISARPATKREQKQYAEGH